MKKFRFFFALYAAKACQFLLRRLGRNATYFPGKVALKLCPHFLAFLTPPKTVVAVTGTNGKTTVSNLITSILKDNGFSVTNNSLGSNVQAGVVSALAEDTTLAGKPKKDIAVLEVDERSSPRIYPDLKPDYLVCNNIMRDSLKRNAHTEFISFIINQSLPESTTLILNADDLNAALLGSETQKRIYFGVEAEKPEESLPQHICDVVYCPKCGAKLESEYIRYNHIGRVFCPGCGLHSPAPDFAVTQIDRADASFTVRWGGQEERFHLINDNIVNIYNFCGVIALLNQLGLPTAQIQKGFADSGIVKSRFEALSVREHGVTLLMAKGQNPIACARCFDYAAKAPGEKKCLLIMVDDRDDNTNNSESTCWLYDCDYSALTDASIGRIVFGGPRCRDHYLRALLAGVPPEKIAITDGCPDTAELVPLDSCGSIFVLYDLYRAADAAAVKQRLLEKVREEETV